MFPCWMWRAWPACSEQQGLINNTGFIRVLPWLPQVSDGKLSGASDLGMGYSLGTRSQPCLARLPVPLPGQEQEGTQRDTAASLLCPVPAHVPLAALLGCWPWAGAGGPPGLSWVVWMLHVGSWGQTRPCHTRRQRSELGTALGSRAAPKCSRSPEIWGFGCGLVLPPPAVQGVWVVHSM